MLLEFSVENYRSLRELQTLSMIADEGKQDPAQHLLQGPAQTLVLPVAMIYGANASGKSNLMRAFQVMRQLISESAKYVPDQPLEDIDPFKFHHRSRTQPTSFEVNFLIDTVRYRYRVSCTAHVVVEEGLWFYPQGREARLFTRSGQTFSFGDSLKGQKQVVADLTAPNQLFLSKGAQNNLPQLVAVYRFFAQDLMAIPFLNSWADTRYLDLIAKSLFNEEQNRHFSHNFKQLVKALDTGVSDFRIEKKDFVFDTRYDIIVSHPITDDAGQDLGTVEQPLKEESTGTQKLFVLGGLLLRALSFGRTIIIDEFERSLHPFVSAFLIQVFQDKGTNPHGAQLIIATHDTYLLSGSDLRRDQIWLIEKDASGASTLFSLADVRGLRADVPLEKWYLSGRFGGVPGLATLNFELNYQDETVEG
jgi:predicted ATPase